MTFVWRYLNFLCLCYLISCVKHGETVLSSETKCVFIHKQEFEVLFDGERTVLTVHRRIDYSIQCWT